MEQLFAKAASGLTRFSLAAVVVIALAPMYFTHPLADDLARWKEGAQDGWFSVARHNYLDWCGRWAATGMEGAVLPWLKGHRYGAALAVLALVQFAACYAFARLTLGDCTSRRIGGGLAVGLFALYWSGMPAPGETVYWVSGGIEYGLSVSLATILVWLAVALKPAGRLARWAGIAALCLLAVLVTGLHELTGLMLVIVLAVAAVIAYRLRSDRLPIWCWLLLASAAGLLFNGLAPGNAVRAAQFAHAQSIGRTIGLTAKFMLRDVAIWIADPRLITASLFLFLSPWFTRLRPAWLLWDVIPWNRIVPVLGISFVVLGAAVPAFATSGSPPGRAENLLHFVFLLTWFTTLLVVTRWPENWILRREQPGPMLQTAAVAVLGIALLATGNTALALRDFDKRMSRWHTALLQREQLAEAADAGSHLVVPETPPQPALFFASDIRRDPADWRNQLFAAFYDLASVRIETEVDRHERQAHAHAPSAMH